MAKPGRNTKIKMIHKSRVSGQKVVRVLHINHGHKRMVWMAEDGTIWPAGLVDYVPEGEE